VASLPKSYLTPEQYLEIERKAEYKSEYYDGEMFAMSGASRAHNTVTLSLASSLYQQLRGRPCEAYANDMRVFVPATRLYAYPDAIVVCGEPRFADAHVDTLLNPTVIVEVLSPTTEGYDRGRKSENYRTIESLKEYLLVAQERVHVDLFTRGEDGRWVLSEAGKLEDTVELRSIGCRLTLREVYERVDLARAEAPGQPA
jgi:Uma2 family endonuclease